MRIQVSLALRPPTLTSSMVKDASSLFPWDQIKAESMRSVCRDLGLKLNSSNRAMMTHFLERVYKIGCESKLLFVFLYTPRFTNHRTLQYPKRLRKTNPNATRPKLKPSPHPRHHENELEELSPLLPFQLVLEEGEEDPLQNDVLTAVQNKKQKKEQNTKTLTMMMPRTRKTTMKTMNKNKNKNHLHVGLSNDPGARPTVLLPPSSLLAITIRVLKPIVEGECQISDRVLGVRERQQQQQQREEEDEEEFLNR